MTVYGRINNAIQFSDPGGSADSTTDVSGIASRFGVKASSDLGNGLTAHGRYEFSTTTDKEGGGIDDTRIATVGISGGFGRVDVGNQWSSFYNTVGTDMDPTYWVAGISGSTPYRSSNTIKYSNSVGPLSLQADLRLNGKAEGADSAEGLRGDGGGIGLRVAVTDSFTLAAAYDTEDQSDEMMTTAAVYGGYSVGLDADELEVLGLDSDDLPDATPDNTNDALYCVTEAQARDKVAKLAAHNTAENTNHDASVTAIAVANGLPGRCMVSAASTTKGAETDRIGISAHMSMGQFWGKLGWTSKEVTQGGMSKDTDYTQLWLGTSLSDSTSAMVGYGKSETDGSTAEPDALTLGLYHNMGGGLRLWYEGKSSDADDGSDKSTDHYVGIRYDF